MAILSKVLNLDRKDRLQTDLSRASSSASNASSVHHHIKMSSSSSHTHHNTAAKNVKPPVVLQIDLELPPIVMYGTPTESTGSIISGLLRVEIDTLAISPIPSGNLSPTISSRSMENTFRNVTSSSKTSLQSLEQAPSTTPPKFSDVDISNQVALEKVTLSLIQTVHLTKPFLLNSVTLCKNCSNRKETLARWDVVTEKTFFADGGHAYPFSHLLPGSLPPSSKLALHQLHLFVKYDLIAEAITKEGPVRIELPINISRSILRGPDRNSVRVFPPTEITTSAVLPNVVYPKLQFPIELKIDNINSESGDRRWRMRKLQWRIEESVKIRAQACEKHSTKLVSAEESQKKSDLLKELKNGGQTNIKPNTHHSTITTSSYFGNSPTVQQRRLLQIRRQQQQNLQIDEEPERQTNSQADARSAFDEDFRLGGQTHSSPLSSTNSSHSTPTIPPLPEPEAAPIENEDHLYYEESRTVARGEIKSGWKSDFSGKGRIELVADINANNLSSGFVRHQQKKSSLEENIAPEKIGLRNGATISCDIDDPNLGIYVSHTLLVEIVIAEELLGEKPKAFLLSSAIHPVKLTSSMQLSELRPIDSASTAILNASANAGNVVGVLSGSARVLRMQFKLPFTERSGLGIAWDDEVPPTYENVRALSPPNYLDLGVATPCGLGFSTPLNDPSSGVLFGIGDTPLTGNFGLSHDSSIDQIVDLDDRIQELTI